MRCSLAFPYHTGCVLVLCLYVSLCSLRVVTVRSPVRMSSIDVFPPSDRASPLVLRIVFSDLVTALPWNQSVEVVPSLGTVMGYSWMDQATLYFGGPLAASILHLVIAPDLFTLPDVSLPACCVLGE